MATIDVRGLKVKSAWISQRINSDNVSSSSRSSALDMNIRESANANPAMKTCNIQHSLNAARFSLAISEKRSAFFREN